MVPYRFFISFLLPASNRVAICVEYRQGTRHADVDTVEDRDGVIVTESLVASSELYCLCMYQ
jgi:hypothetical protein